jgi:ketosteroid isomerase-like protein
MRIRRYSCGLAAALLAWSGATGTWADPPPGTQGAAAAGSATGGAQVSEVKGGFFSTLTQAFKVDFDRDVVRGHFDTGTPPGTHRYYCLVDPRSGKKAPNAVSGQPTPRRSGMTGITGGAVTPLSCEDAEQKGLLVTAGYTVGGGASSANVSAGSPGVAPGGVNVGAAGPAAGSATPASAASAPRPLSATGSADSPLPKPAAAAVAGAPVDGALQSEVMAVYSRFIAAQNAHDRAAVSQVLLESNDFVWVQDGGTSVWGYKAALAAFEQEWKGTWKLDPQLKQVRIASPAPDVALLVTPLVFTAGNPGQSAATIPVRWGGVFVRTKSGWRISSIFITPFRDWRAADGS